jgi:predicted RNA-binding Zn ribbon-like protein
MDLPVVGPDEEMLLLDLLNTTPVIDNATYDELSSLKVSRSWMLQHGVAPSNAELAALRHSRSILQAVVRGEKTPDALRPYLDKVILRPAIADDGLSWHTVVDKGFHGAVRAVLAWDMLRINLPGRLRPCENDECQLFLIDHSKPNTARWCSMAICGNRMKARRHSRRRRSEPSR